MIELLRTISRTGPVPVRVRGTCMAPAIADGAIVHVHARRMMWPGDVIVAVRGSELVAHRVIGWRPRGIVTKGDGCVVHDLPVARRDIIGVADLRVPLRERMRALAAFAEIVWRRLSR